MKFRPDHTVAFMRQQAIAKADGYFELTVEEARHVSITSELCLSVQRKDGLFLWRHGNKEISEEAAHAILHNWRSWSHGA